MQEIKLNLDGQDIMVEEGLTVLDAAKRAGIQIPTLCAMPELGFTSGSCRVCVVEIEGEPTLSASCMTSIREGMVIHTNSKRVIEARRVLVELLISRHPLDCMTCEENGNCDLQDIAYDLNIKETRFGRNNKDIPLDETNPFIVRDLNKCILCGRCVEICNEIQQSHAIGFGYRGSETEIIAGVGNNLGFETKMTSGFNAKIKYSNCVSFGQ
jgi:formate dehydrogenase alpha subunit